MQELLNSPQPAPQPGPPVPGTTGGLPSLGGLSVTQNPMAQQLQSMGRGEDSMLVHMTPAEVNSLQGLAMASGGSLTINPHTGLPEAGWLGKLLPTLLGFAGAAFGLPTWAIGLGGAAAGTAATGNLGQGLMMGLQAFGGASLAGGLGVGEAGKKAAEAVAAGGAGGGAGGAQTVAEIMKSPDMTGLFGQTAQQAPGVLSKTPGFFEKFGTAAKAGMPGGVLSKAAPALAASGLLSGVSAATTPNLPKYTKEEDKFKYTPMAPGKREVRFQTPEQMRDTGGAEFAYFTPSNPEPVPVSALPLYEQDKYRFAEGGLAAIPPQGFNELVDYFGATNPGAITASMYPVSAPVQPSSGGEQVYNFRPQTPTAPTQGGSGAMVDGGYTGGIPNFGGFDYSSIDWNAIRDNLGLNQMQQLPTQQPNYAAPVYDMPSNISDYGIAPTQSLPIEQPNYQMPNMLDIYDRGMMAPELSSGQPLLYNLNDEDRFASYRGLDEYAKGGAVNMRDGSFVVDARTVSELGNGSSNAGIETLARMGGRPVRGPGDGVSDSVPASIGGKQEARVARDEVIFPPEAVRRVGGGSEKRGTQKLYALMDKAHKARKKAKRGQDTGVRKGLA